MTELDLLNLARSNTEVEVDVMSAVWPVRGNRTMAELLQRNIELVGMPMLSTIDLK